MFELIASVVLLCISIFQFTLYKKHTDLNSNYYKEMLKIRGKKVINFMKYSFLSACVMFAFLSLSNFITAISLIGD